MYYMIQSCIQTEDMHMMIWDWGGIHRGASILSVTYYLLGWLVRLCIFITLFFMLYAFS